MAARPRRARRGVSFDAVRDLALALPGMEEGTSYGTPAFRVRKKLVARLKEDGESMVLMVTMDEKEALLLADPKVYFTTPHYDGYAAILVRFAEVDRRELAELIEGVWRRVAPKRVVAAYDDA